MFCDRYQHVAHFAIGQLERLDARLLLNNRCLVAAVAGTRTAERRNRKHGKYKKCIIAQRQSRRLQPEENGEQPDANTNSPLKLLLQTLYYANSFHVLLHSFCTFFTTSTHFFSFLSFLFFFFFLFDANDDLIDFETSQLAKAKNKNKTKKSKKQKLNYI